MRACPLMHSAFCWGADFLEVVPYAHGHITYYDKKYQLIKVLVSKRFVHLYNEADFKTVSPE